MNSLKRLAIGVLVTVVGWAMITGAQAQKPQTKTTAVKIKVVGKGTKVVKGELSFNLSPTLKLTHVFQDGDLKHVRITNTGEPVQITMFNKNYYLGKKDSVVIDIPNVKEYFVSVEPVSERSLLDPIKSRGAQRTFQVKDVTPQKNHTTSI